MKQISIREIINEYKTKIQTNIDSVPYSLGESVRSYNSEREIERGFLGMLRWSHGGMPVSQDRSGHAAKDLCYELIEIWLPKKYLKGRI